MEKKYFCQNICYFNIELDFWSIELEIKQKRQKKVVTMKELLSPLQVRYYKDISERKKLLNSLA